ncbi:O-acyltransferase WSD1-like protein [Tanacetum coccineum]
MDEQTIRGWMKEQQDRAEKMAQQQQQQAATFQAQFEALRAKLHASLGQLQGRPGGNGDQGSLLPRSMRLDVPKFTRKDPEKCTVEEYQSEFEKLMNRVMDLPDSLLISYYISGLKLHLQRELLVSKPTIFGDVFSLARIIEARFDDQAAPVAGTSAGLKANKVVNDGDDSKSSESTYDNDARDQVSELEIKVLVNGKQYKAKVVRVVVVAVEQNIDEPDVEGKIKGLDYNSKKDVIPKNIHLRATFFFNLRATTRIDTLVETMKTGKMGQWGNKIGYVLLLFTIGLKSNPLDYVKKAKAVIDGNKASLEPLYTFFVLYVVLKLFGIKALMIHIVSYMGKLTFAISADEETIPGPQQLCDDLEETLYLIKSSALGTESAKNK